MADLVAHAGQQLGSDALGVPFKLTNGWCTRCHGLGCFLLLLLSPFLLLQPLLRRLLHAVKLSVNVRVCTLL